MADITIPNNKWNSRGKAVRAEAVTPHATEKREYDALWVGNDDAVPSMVGNLVIRAKDSDVDVTLYNVVAGTPIPISVRYIRDTTTCTNIVGFVCCEE
jgi:hypothetical protein